NEHAQRDHKRDARPERFEQQRADDRSRRRLRATAVLDGKVNHHNGDDRADGDRRADDEIVKAVHSRRDRRGLLREQRDVGEQHHVAASEWREGLRERPVDSRRSIRTTPTTSANTVKAPPTRTAFLTANAYLPWDSS